MVEKQTIIKSVINCFSNFLIKVNSSFCKICFRRPERSGTNNEFILTPIFNPEIKNSRSIILINLIIDLKQKKESELNSDYKIRSNKLGCKGLALKKKVSDFLPKKFNIPLILVFYKVFKQKLCFLRIILFVSTS